jgi:hypothetical protein
MFINREGKIINMDGEVVQIGDTTNIKKSWVIRMIATRATPYGMKKEVIGEEPFDSEPTEQQIMWCLAKYTHAEFAVKEEIYKLVDDGLPF